MGKLRNEDRDFLQNRLVWYDTPTEGMRLLKMRLHVETHSEVKCRVYSGVGGVGAMLPAGMFLYGCVTTHARNGFTLSGAASLLPALVKHTETYVAYIALQPGIRFSQSVSLLGVRTFSPAKLPILALKRACVRKLRTLNINYTQLVVKVKFFFKKNNYFRKHSIVGSVFSKFTY